MFKEILNEHVSEEILEKYFDLLWPLLRSITGSGYQETHEIISQIVDLKRISFKTGDKVFDWKIPQVWECKDAYIKNPEGKKVISLKDNNLHVVNYSSPINKQISLNSLKKNLYFLKDFPEAIPYVTSYYEKNWGFCITHNQLKDMKDGVYNVKIDSNFSDGELFVSEAFLKGESDKEIFFSTYTCHPSMASNELSGPLIAMFLYLCLSKLKKRKYSYRFLFSAETIGTIAYLSKKYKKLKKNMVAGYVLTCLGDNKPFNFKKSRDGNLLVNRVAEYNLKKSKIGIDKIYDFFPTGSDERQYCSPGIDLPVACITRSMFGKFKEYHTSMDNKDFINFRSMVETIETLLKICETFETNQIFYSNKQFCEPFLSKHNLYETVNIPGDLKQITNTILWLISFSDGNNDLLKISQLSNIDYFDLLKASKICLEKKLLSLKKCQ